MTFDEIEQELLDVKNLYLSGSLEESKSKLNPLLLRLNEEPGAHAAEAYGLVPRINFQVSSSNPFND